MHIFRPLVVAGIILLLITVYNSSSDVVFVGLGNEVIGILGDLLAVYFIVGWVD